MSSGKHRFRRTETTRAVAATATAVAPFGLKVTGVEFEGGKMRVLVGDRPPASDDGKPNPWDKPGEDAQRSA
jgi:hypothetical protein